MEEFSEQPDERPIDQHESSPSLIAWGSIFEFLKTIGFILIFAFLIRQFLIQPFVVEGSSMLPNFHNAEYILVDKFSYLTHQPKRGDVVVFLPAHEPDNFIKRVIGLPGDTIRIAGKQITVNTTPLAEPYLASDDQPTTTEPSGATTLERILGTDEYFVLGDNRDNSRDSRDIGAVHRSQIVGRAWLILFPLDDFLVVGRPSYPALTAPGNDQALVHDQREPVAVSH